MCDTAILMATYNGERYISEQLDSILNQSYRDVICYIHDDGSTDRTIAIINKYIENNPGKFILVDGKSTGGACTNFMFLMKYAALNSRAKYYLFSDQDDVWSPEKIAIEVGALKDKEREFPNTPILVYCDQKIVDADLHVISESGMKFSKRKVDADEYHNLIFENCAPGCVMCINRNLLEKSARLEHINNINMHDWWVMLVARTMGEVQFVSESLMLYRQHGDNTLGADSKEFFMKVKRYLHNLPKSLKSKENCVTICERQVEELYSLGYGGRYLTEITQFVKMCRRNKFYRMFFCLKNNYLTLKTWFTVLFV